MSVNTTHNGTTQLNVICGESGFSSELHDLIVNTFTPGFLDALHKDTLNKFATAMQEAYQLGVTDTKSENKVELGGASI